MRGGFQRRSSRWSAITTPAVSAAALDPMPLPRGMSFWIRSSMGGSCMPCSPRHGEGGLPDQVIGAGGDLRRIAPFGADRELAARPEAAGEVDAQRQPERIEAGPQVGARSRNPHACAST